MVNGVVNTYELFAIIGKHIELERRTAKALARRSGSKSGLHYRSQKPGLSDPKSLVFLGLSPKPEAQKIEARSRSINTTQL